MSEDIRHVAVVDIGKTNAKLALVDLVGVREVDIRKMPNAVLAEGLYPHYDTESIWRFLLEGLAALARSHRVDAISVTTHGAAAALLDLRGELAMPILDYEHGGPDRLRHEYEAVRPPQDETGSPSLPGGLNLGAQLYWLSRSFPATFSKAVRIVAYPQFWAYRLTGVAANEVTSLGCHTDLWAPRSKDYSSLVDRMGWRSMFAPIRGATERLSVIRPAIAKRTGLDTETPVFCGIHDSNASLVPHLLSRKPPFAVVSTGTWIVAMAVGGRPTPARDLSGGALLNVSAFGDPVPSMRFMGGRDFSRLTRTGALLPTEKDVEAVLMRRIFLVPADAADGEYMPRWLADDVRHSSSEEEAHVAASFYLAMTTDHCLERTGAEGEIVVEGVFSDNPYFVGMLAAATGRDVFVRTGTTGASVGAALLANPSVARLELKGESIPPPVASWAEYARGWRQDVERSCRAR